MTPRRSASLQRDGGFAEAFENMLMKLLAQVPATDQAPSDNPTVQTRAIARTAAKKAAILSGSLSLAPGPLGWLTILPDLAAVWRLQQEMVAQIAAAFGKSSELSRETMFYCLFRHVAAHLVRDVAVRVGGRALVREVPLRVLEQAVRRVGVRVSERVISRGIARWVPVAGAMGVAAYAYYDTMRVADTAIELFGAKLLPGETKPSE